MDSHLSNALTALQSVDLKSQVVIALVALSLSVVLVRWSRYRNPVFDVPFVDDPQAESKSVQGQPSEYHMRWLKEKKSTVISYMSGGKRQLFVADPKALAWVLGSNGYRFGSTAVTDKFTPKLLGHGLVSAQGETHKRQRRAINPAFHPRHLKALVPIFTATANKMAARIDEDRSLVAKYGQEKGKVVEMQRHLSAATLDIIGQAGFDYNFSSLDTGSEQDSEMSKAFSDAMKASYLAAQGPIERFFLSPFFARNLPSVFCSNLFQRNYLVDQARRKMERITLDLIAKKKESIRQELLASGEEGENKDSEAFKGEDILHILVRANMAKGLKPYERLKDHELIGQATTFVFAGHETTSTAMSHLLHYMSTHPAAQTKLQNELDAFYESLAGDDITWDNINALHFLNNCSNEVLRLSPPVTFILRAALHDDAIPLSRPMPSDQTGEPLTHLKVKKGTEMFLGLRAINRDEQIWGPDAGEFNPDRWDNLPQSYHDAHLPGGTATFSQGVKVCIGMRFATTELKVLAATIFRKWRVEPVEKFKEAQFIVVRPVIIGRESEGGQMPVRLIERA